MDARETESETRGGSLPPPRAPPRVLLLAGPIGSGKDHIASRLAASAGYERVALADPLKDLAAEAEAAARGEPACRSAIRALFDDRAAKDAPSALLGGRVPRAVLVERATALRAADPAVFLRAAIETARGILERGGRVVVTDARFRSEVEGFRGAFPGDARLAWVERTDPYPRVHDAICELGPEGAGVGGSGGSTSAAVDVVLTNRGPGADDEAGWISALIE